MEPSSARSALESLLFGDDDGADVSPDTTPEAMAATVDERLLHLGLSPLNLTDTSLHSDVQRHVATVVTELLDKLAQAKSRADDHESRLHRALDDALSAKATQDRLRREADLQSQRMASLEEKARQRSKQYQRLEVKLADVEAEAKRVKRSLQSQVDQARHETRRMESELSKLKAQLRKKLVDVKPAIISLGQKDLLAKPGTTKRKQWRATPSSIPGTAAASVVEKDLLSQYETRVADLRRENEALVGALKAVHRRLGDAGARDDTGSDNAFAQHGGNSPAGEEQGETQATDERSSRMALERSTTYDESEHATGPFGMPFSLAGQDMQASLADRVDSLIERLRAQVPAKDPADSSALDTPSKSMLKSRVSALEHALEDHQRMLTEATEATSDQPDHSFLREDLQSFPSPAPASASTPAQSERAQAVTRQQIELQRQQHAAHMESLISRLRQSSAGWLHTPSRPSRPQSSSLSVSSAASQ